LLALLPLGRLRPRRREPFQLLAAECQPVQASPAGGCAYWSPGVGDSLPPGWMPVGFRPWDGPRIYGQPATETQPPAVRDERPHLPCEQFEYEAQRGGVAPYR